MGEDKNFDKFLLQKFTEKRKFLDDTFRTLEEIKKIKPDKEISLSVLQEIDLRKLELEIEKLNEKYPDYIKEVYDLLKITNLEELENLSLEEIQEKHNLSFNNISRTIEEYDITKKEDYLYKIRGSISSEIFEKKIIKENKEVLSIKNFFVSYLEEGKIKKINVNVYPYHFSQIEDLKINDPINITGKIRKNTKNGKAYTNLDLKELEKVNTVSKKLPVQVVFKGNLAENPIVKEFKNHTKYINIAIYENTQDNGSKINYCTVIGDNLIKEFENLRKGDFIEVKGEKTTYISDNKEHENVRIYSFREIKKNINHEKEQLKEYWIIKGSDSKELQKYNNNILDENLCMNLQEFIQNKESDVKEQNIYFDYLNGGEVKATITVKLGDINNNFIEKLDSIRKENKEVGIEEKKEELTR